MDAKTKKTWISVVVALLIIIVILGVTLVGSAWYFIHRHINAQFVSADVASQEFDRERARFAGQEPLIELKGEYQEPVLHKRTAPEHAELQALRVLAFDPRARKLVHVSIPFWILRFARNKPFRFSSDIDDFDSERLHLTVDDVERAGPGLILDTRMRRDGALVLVWAE